MCQPIIDCLRGHSLQRQCRHLCGALATLPRGTASQQRIRLMLTASPVQTTVRSLPRYKVNGVFNMQTFMNYQLSRIRNLGLDSWNTVGAFSYTDEPGGNRTWADGPATAGAVVYTTIQLGRFYNFTNGVTYAACMTPGATCDCGLRAAARAFSQPCITHRTLAPTRTHRRHGSRHCAVPFRLLLRQGMCM